MKLSFRSAILGAFILLLGAMPTFAQTPAAPEAPATDAEASIEQLITIIENDETRAALIDRLRADAAGTQEAEPAAADLSIVGQLANYTRAAAEGASETLQSLLLVGESLQRGVQGTLDADFAAFSAVAMGLLVVAAGLFAAFWAFRFVVNLICQRLADRALNRRFALRLGSLVAATLSDAASIVLAWGVGYVVALLFAGNGVGSVGINQSFLLNAFLIVELGKLSLRTVLQPHYPPLRLVPVADGDAAYWTFWVNRVVSLLGYSFLFLAPVLAGTLGRSAAGVVQLLAMTGAVVLGIVLVLQSKAGLRERLQRISQRRHHDSWGQALTAVGQYWHFVAIAYLLVLYVLWLTDPNNALPFILTATAQSAVIVLVGLALIAFIGRFVGEGVRLPADVNQRLPLLQSRLHAFVPRVMAGVRLVVVVCVLLAILQAWTVFDVLSWLATARGQQVVGSIISAILIVVACFALYLVVASWVEYRLNTAIGKTPTMREKTLLGLFKNAFTIALVVFGAMLALAQVGVNIGPLLAGAGVVGLAIGFGAQKLVQDIITGIFIQFENVMNEGDTVEAAGKAGTVEKLTIRSVTIRDMSGTVHLIPFSSVDLVSNMARGFSFYVAEFEVAYDSDIEQVKQVMRDAFAKVMETEHKSVILDDLDLQGLVAITATSMTVRARIKTLAGKQWGPGRLFSELVKDQLRAHGVQSPTARITYLSAPSHEPAFLPDPATQA